ncbi:MAG: hypothetical protein KA118_04225 [Verrucomicrobia bacterium]|nr:hypothetical protein [Verrucomicrobiota bacterium]
MEQWDRIFSYGEHLGMYLHFKTLETKNELTMDGGNLGLERSLYYRELIARFGCHLARNWNLGQPRPPPSDQHPRLGRPRRPCPSSAAPCGQRWILAVDMGGFGIRS